MELSEKKKREYTRRLLQSRMRLLTTNGFFGLLLMHVRFGLDENIKYKTACTNGERILFHPQFLDMLTDKELDTILMHELLHIVLRHCFRYGDRDPDQFNTACDIVVNSNILLSNNNNPDSIRIIDEELMHLTPNNEEGHKYTAEQVYAMLSKNRQKDPDPKPGFWPETSSLETAGEKGLPDRNGKKKEDSKELNSSGKPSSETNGLKDDCSERGNELQDNCPGEDTDSASDKPSGGKDCFDDNHSGGKKGSQDEHLGDKNDSKETNSGEKAKSSDESFKSEANSHDDCSGSGEVRRDNHSKDENGLDDDSGNKEGLQDNRAGRNGCFKDDHSRWKENDALRDEWTSRIRSAYEVIRHTYENREAGSVPEGIERLCGQLLRPKVDWKKELQDFIQQEICDYSFTPPDSRFGDSEFFLPDFNEKEDCLHDILFMVDASGSITERELTLAMSEIRGCIEQFSGRLKGWIGFFDAAVYDPVPIESVQDFERVMPKGGGGTDFGIIYEYIAKSMYNSLPACLVVLTDGYAEFSSESQTLRIPTMWLLNNKDIRPPFGRVIFMESKEFD